VDLGYANIVDRSIVVWLFLAYLIHLVMVFAQAGLAVFLIASGARGVLPADCGTRLLRRSGKARIRQPDARLYGRIGLVLGVLLLLPFLLGVPFWFSLLACLGALGLLAHLERRIPTDVRRPGRFARRSAIAFAALAAAFMLWEREDNVALGVELLTTSKKWRSAEVAWQTASDRNSPQVGDLAPDFELQDPSGTRTVRLSDFRGKRPVGLVFGSYT
jgi:hypothetical protein